MQPDRSLLILRLVCVVGSLNLASYKILPVIRLQGGTSTYMIHCIGREPGVEFMLLYEAITHRPVVHDRRRRDEVVERISSLTCAKGRGKTMTV